MGKEIALADNMKDQEQTNGNNRRNNPTSIYGTADNIGDCDIELETGNVSEYDLDDDVTYDDEGCNSQWSHLRVI